MSWLMSWCESQGQVSRAFDEWKLIDHDQRTFLRLGLEFASREYDRGRMRRDTHLHVDAIEEWSIKFDGWAAPSS